MRASVMLLALLFVLPVVGATHPEEDIAPGEVWVVYNRVEVDVVDNYATVQVIAEIGNRGPDPEFPFQVRLPEDAFVTGLRIERDDEVWEGRIEDRDVARQEYEEEKAKENTAALVEKKRGTQVFAFLVNVAAQESVTATLTYEIYLKADQGVYTLPLEAPVSGFGHDLGAEFNARICHSDGVSGAWSEPAGQGDASGECFERSYSVGPRGDAETTPWSLHYQLEPTADEGSIVSLVTGGQGYFAHRFRAPADGEQLPLDLVLVLDTSGSMSREQKLEQMVDAAVQVVGMLDSDDRLAIVEFDSDTYTTWSGLAAADKAHRDEAIEAIQDFIAGGSTHIQAGMEQGYASYDGSTACTGDLEVPVSLCDEPRSRIIVFLTDGQPTLGITEPAALRAHIKSENPGDVRVFGLAFGQDAAWSLVAGIARDNGGAALLVPQGAGAEVDLRRFMAALTTPVLEDVDIDYDGDVTAYRSTAEVLFQGSEMLVVGTVDKDLDRISGSVTGLTASGQRSYDFDEAVGGGPSILPRIVAYAQIQHLQSIIDAEGEDADTVAQLKALALEWGFVTDYTSLVILTEVDEPTDSSAEGSSDGGSDGSSAPSFDRGSADSGSMGGGSSDGGSMGGGSVSGGSGGMDAGSDAASEDGDSASTPVPLWAALVALAAALVLRRR